MEEVVVSQRHVEEIPRRDAWRVVIVVFRPGRRNLEQRRAILRGGAQAARADRGGRRRMHAAAKESGLKLLIGRKPRKINGGIGSIRPVVAMATRAWHLSGHLAAVVAPGEAEPRSVLPGLVLQVRRLVEHFVVIDRKSTRLNSSHLG